MNQRGFDFKGIGHIHFTMTLPENVRVPSLLKCLMQYFIHTFYHLVLHPFNSFPLESEILFVSQSINNQRTLCPITEYLATGKWRVISICDFPSSLIYRYSLASLWQFISFYRGCSKEEQRRIRRVFHDFALAAGMYKVDELYLARCKNLRTIVVANDHTIPVRCLIEAARRKTIPVVYTQHAPVTDRFPPLHFAYSFLDGMESYEKYRNIGDIKGKVILLGSPRFDEVMSKKRILRKKSGNAVGIGMGHSDSIGNTIQLCVFIKEKTHKNVIVRPHPRSMQSFDKELFLRHGISISDSRIESSYVFFTKIEVLIANKSGIHLDAAIFGIPSVVFNLSNMPIRDWYGFISKGLISIANTYDEVIGFIQSKRIVSEEVVQYYYAAFNTPFDGRIAETIASFLRFSHTEVGANNYLRSQFEETEHDLYVIKR